VSRAHAALGRVGIQLPDRELRTQIAEDVARHQRPLLAAGAFAAPGAAALAIPLVGVPVLWAVIPTVAGVLAWVAGARAVDHPDFARRWRVAIGAVVISGASWGTLPWFGSGDSLTVASYLGVFVVLSMVFAAPSRAHALGFASGLTGAAMVSLVTVGEPLLGALMVLAFGCALVLQLYLHSAVVTSIVNARSLTTLSEQLLRDAMTDPLTGLANRRVLGERLAEELDAASRNGSTVALALIDVDRFKVINDSLGHGVGDELLLHITARLQDATRPGDILARLGGDEFAVVFRQLHDADDAESIAERIRATIGEPYRLEPRRLDVTASIGVAHNLDSDNDPDELLRWADVALYRAKDLGRDRVEVFDSGMRAEAARRADDEAELRRAIHAGEIVPWFQPEIDLATGRIVGAEALARWVKPDGTAIPAGAFISLARESGMLDALDQRLMLGVLDARSGLHARQAVGSDFRMRFNVQPEAVAQTGGIDRLIAALSRRGCPADGLGLEVVETGLIANLDVASRQLEVLRALGMTVALDDFGTGNSSLSLVHRLPLDALKIDRSFVSVLPGDATARALVSVVLGLARELGLSVTAEGVETAEQAALLRSMGCQRGQGYLWSPAVPLDQLLVLVAAHDAAAEDAAPDPLAA
jgi:diguanylate cyclase (GGDEF)-like protein